jgi:hypothetical protein
MRLLGRVCFFMLIGLTAARVVSLDAWAQATAQIAGVVKDGSGAVLPGVEIKATQTATGAARTAVSGEDGRYVLPNLPLGPYMVEASLPGFRTYVQTGIVLQVNSDAAINPILELGQVTETVEVRADAALVETRNSGVGTVMDNQRVLELPLNGRQVTELIFLAGMANPGVANNGVRNYPTVAVSVAGGIGGGVAFWLDGANHNDPYNNLNLPLPFPDALQEFKLETSATQAQYGFHSSSAVNAVTKSGTNEFHGDAFEFVRNGVFNARNFFAAKRDTLKRNQYGGVIGGPIIKNKLFFFGAYQGTPQRSDPPTIITYVPTPDMLAGDFTTVASPACNGNRQLTLAASQGFVNNRIPVSRFDPVALKITSLLPTPVDPCGKVTYGLKTNSDEHVWVSRIDYQRGDKNSWFGRVTVSDLNLPSTYDGKNALTVSSTAAHYRVYAPVIGTTYLIGSGIVASFRASATRSDVLKPADDFYSLGQLGAKDVVPLGGNTFRMSVGGAFSINSGNGVPNRAISGPSANVAGDISIVRGAHQIGFGSNYIHPIMNFLSGLNPVGNFTFDGSMTGGLGMADFLLGAAASWNQGTFNTWTLRANYVGVYGQDTWKMTSRLTASYGLRWEPYWAPSSRFNAFAHFDPNLFDQNVHSSLYANAPAGLIFPGDPQYTIGNHPRGNKANVFMPRLGLAWDVKGDARMTVRAAWGMFSERTDFQGYSSFTGAAPYGNNISLTNVSLSNPWGNYPGGNPFPLVLNKNIPFATFATYRTDVFDYHPPYMNQWNLSVQKQIGTDWLITANYVGNNMIHMIAAQELNPARFLGLGACAINGVNYPTCSTTGNTNQRRVLFLKNAAQGQYYARITQLDDGGTETYDGLFLSAQKRVSHHVSALGNYTWSHCISDVFEPDLGTGATSTIPGNRRANRSNCVTSDLRHVFNFSGVIQGPAGPVLSGGFARAVASNWQLSPIVKVKSATFFTVTSGVDRALSATPNQTPDQIGNPYPANQSVRNWITASAFSLPVLGSYGTLGHNNLKGPGSFQIDAALSRTFQIREKQTVQLRAEAFNILNHANFNPPVATLNSGSFGQIQSALDPRILQFALKYVF